MGTNYYARIIPKEEDKQKLKEAIDNNDYSVIESMVAEMYGPLDEYTHKGGKIHLGKSSGGWKFLWNPNVIKYYSIDHEIKECVSVVKYDYVYPLTKQGITDFVMREDVIIYDEYGEIQDKQRFLDFAFNKEGIDCKEYYTNPKYNAGYYYPREYSMFKELGFKPEFGEFYSDGLRFSTSIDFS